MYNENAKQLSVTLALSINKILGWNTKVLKWVDMTNAIIKHINKLLVLWNKPIQTEKPETLRLQLVRYNKVIWTKN